MSTIITMNGMTGDKSMKNMTKSQKIFVETMMDESNHLQRQNMLQEIARWNNINPDWCKRDERCKKYENIYNQMNESDKKKTWEIAAEFIYAYSRPNRIAMSIQFHNHMYMCRKIFDKFLDIAKENGRDIEMYGAEDVLATEFANAYKKADKNEKAVIDIFADKFFPLLSNEARYKAALGFNKYTDRINRHPGKTLENDFAMLMIMEHEISANHTAEDESLNIDFSETKEKILKELVRKNVPLEKIKAEIKKCDFTGELSGKEYICQRELDYVMDSIKEMHKNVLNEIHRENDSWDR